jgi:hypothetical protein
MKEPKIPIRKAPASRPKKTYTDKNGDKKTRKDKAYKKMYAAWVAKEQAKDEAYAKEYTIYLDEMAKYTKLMGEEPEIEDLKAYKPLDLTGVKTKSDLNAARKNR